MRIFEAQASSDYGYIYMGERVKGTSFKVAMSRAAFLAKARTNKRIKKLTITLIDLGKQ